MDNDVSVARLSDDDWNDRTPPGPRSRMRVLAVMGAVVVGCVVAAVAVNLAPDDVTQHADDQGERIVVIDPDRTELYPTTVRTVPTTSGDGQVVVTEVTGLSEDGDTAPDAPWDAPEPGGVDDSPEAPSDDDGGDTDVPPPPDEDHEDSDTPTPPAPSDSPEPPHPTTPSAPPTTTPPEEDEEEEEEEECTPWWWIACW